MHVIVLSIGNWLSTKLHVYIFLLPPRTKWVFFWMWVLSSCASSIITTFIWFWQACGKFINNNSVTKQAHSSSKSPELLARYCDSLLKKRYTVTCILVFSRQYLDTCTTWAFQLNNIVLLLQFLFLSCFASFIFFHCLLHSSKNPEEAELEDILNSVVSSFVLIHFKVRIL